VAQQLQSLARQWVVHQLASAVISTDDFELLCNSIDERLLINLSNITLTSAQVELLKLGYGFRPSVSCNRGQNGCRPAVEHIIKKVAMALHSYMEQDGSSVFGRYNTQHRGSGSSADPSAEHSRKVRFQTCFRGVYRRFSEYFSDMAIAQLDTVSYYHLNRMRGRLACEFENADRHFPRNLSATQTAALRQLQLLVRTRQIIVRKADKSRQICILDTTKYDHAVMAQLADTNSYRPIPFNLNSKCAALIKQCVKKFVKRALLTEKQAEFLLQHTDKPAIRRFYGLPKTHKPLSKWTDGMPPLRPICPDLRTETSVTGCFIAQYLNPLLLSIQSYIKNSYELKQRLLDIGRLYPDAVLLTSDVDSLYPSIPIGPALHRVVQKLDTKAPEFQFIVELLRIQLTHNYFSFNDKTFQQIKGLPMGKAWAPAVASIYMDNWECTLWRKLGFIPIFYVRYIDDLFAIFKTRADAETFVHTAAGHDVHIKLSDTNIGQSVHFLDLQVTIGESGRLNTRLYRKESDLVVLLHRRSAHCARIKDGVIISQMCRFLRLHTDYAEAGRCIKTFIMLMRRFRGLSSTRARALWNKFRHGILSGCIRVTPNDTRTPTAVDDLDRRLTTNAGRRPPVLSFDTLRPNNQRGHAYARTVRIAVPADVRWKRIRLLVDELRDQLSAPQQYALRNVQICDEPTTPLGIALFRH
jgi:hypothetical protein